MNIVAIMASYRKGGTIDTLVDRALAGALDKAPGADANKIVLVDQQIEFCRNCMVCRNDDQTKALATCVIQDSMQAIYPALDAADAFIIGTPINMGNETAILKAFMERCCWVLAKRGARPLKGCPVPRSTRRKNAVAILSSGIVPPWLRLFCDDATPLIRDFCKCSLHARLIDSLYAGNIEKRTAAHYTAAAFRLGQELVRG